MSLWRGTLCTNCKKEHECTEADRMLKSGCIAYGCSTCIPKTTTNADRIRVMSDGELAEIMALWCPPNDPHECHRYEKSDGDLNCSKCWFDWLKEEAESEEKDELTD